MIKGDTRSLDYSSNAWQFPRRSFKAKSSRYKTCPALGFGLRTEVPQVETAETSNAGDLKCLELWRCQLFSCTFSSSFKIPGVAYVTPYTRFGHVQTFEASGCCLGKACSMSAYKIGIAFSRSYQGTTWTSTSTVS